jgi:hypothetical protein
VLPFAQIGSQTQVHIAVIDNNFFKTIVGRPSPRAAPSLAVPIGFAHHHECPGLQAFDGIESPRETDGKRQNQIFIYGLSRTLAPAELLRVARAHWTDRECATLQT